ncbi:hypothetical protein NE237_011611 [Protea cynaroides]|uniref:Uncharacterized protein n=1 Tax=Protea cynaroides TaxID=273540 RepID=A0A9Q0JYF8_9MAGN|nr:hypothetical protein NE237_011611 [Protea cynaroides]
MEDPNVRYSRRRGLHCPCRQTLRRSSCIIDDDGLGYDSDGQEEDWSQAGLPPSSGESEGSIPGCRYERSNCSSSSHLQLVLKVKRGLPKSYSSKHSCKKMISGEEQGTETEKGKNTRVGVGAGDAIPSEADPATRRLQASYPFPGVFYFPLSTIASGYVSSSIRRKRDPKPSSSKSTFGNHSSDEEDTEEWSLEEVPWASKEEASESSSTVKKRS